MRLFERGKYDYEEVVSEIVSMLNRVEAENKKEKKEADRVSLDKNSLQRGTRVHFQLKYSDLMNEYNRLVKIRETKELIIHEGEGAKVVEELGEIGKTEEKERVEEKEARGAGSVGYELKTGETGSKKEMETWKEQKLAGEVSGFVEPGPTGTVGSVSDVLARIKARKSGPKEQKRKNLNYDEEIKMIARINSLNDSELLAYAEEHLPTIYHTFVQGRMKEEEFRGLVKYRIAVDEGVSENTASKYFRGK